MFAGCGCCSPSRSRRKSNAIMYQGIISEDDLTALVPVRKRLVGRSTPVTILGILSATEVELEVIDDVKERLRYSLHGIVPLKEGSHRNDRVRSLLQTKLQSYGNRAYAVFITEDGVELYSPDYGTSGESVNFYLLHYEDPVIGTLVTASGLS